MTRETLPALGYLYVALALPALVVGPDDQHLQAALLTGAAFAYFWFIASLGAKVMRFAPDGFFASVVVAASAAYVPLQVIAVLGDRLLAGPSAACAATTIIGASLAAWRARKIPRWFGQAGIAGGIAVLVVGIVEAGADWTLVDRSVFASSLGFMVWVVVTATYLLRR
ncbi:MAG TPA: hypothetical protein VFJ93_00700 [Gaiellaceae bacterium]|nr:hypothetical protein [Gaiellaceae bacterium]